MQEVGEGGGGSESQETRDKEKKKPKKEKRKKKEKSCVGYHKGIQQDRHEKAQLKDPVSSQTYAILNANLYVSKHHHHSAATIPVKASARSPSLVDVSEEDRRARVAVSSQTYAILEGGCIYEFVQEGEERREGKT